MLATDESALPWPLESRLARLLVFGLAPALLLLGWSSWTEVRRYIREDPDYCAQCHVQKDQYVLWEQDAHHKVVCQKCHRQSLQEAAGMLEAFAYGSPASHSGKHVKMHAAWVDDSTCLACHGRDGRSKQRMDGSALHVQHLKIPRVGCLTCHAHGIHRRSEPETACAFCHPEPKAPACRSGVRCSSCHAFAPSQQMPWAQSAACAACHSSQHAQDADKDCLRCHTMAHNRRQP